MGTWNVTYGDIPDIKTSFLLYTNNNFTALLKMMKISMHLKYDPGISIVKIFQSDV